MVRHFLKLALSCILIASLACQSTTKNTPQLANKVETNALFSPAVNDSFYVQIQLPVEYKDSTQTRYPVVVMLDANFHFPMLAASIHQYEKAGLLPPLVLVGIGYKTFKDMDSLRTRDYLYPAALPSDEMQTAGGGRQFNQFVTSELLTYVDSTYRTKKQNRSLLGHSFGGYFTLYSLLQQATNETRVFTNFVAASPSLWYHNYYLNQLPAVLASHKQQDSVRIFLSVGAIENPVWDVKPVRGLTDKLAKNKSILVKGVVYNQLDHMDTGQLSFLKGLQEFYNR